MTRKSEKQKEYEACLGRVHDLSLDALYTDGAHHKQWYLEHILNNVCKVLALGVGDKDWEDGIAP